MTFTYGDWKKRISRRSDITGMLTHLTRPNNLLNNEANELEISKSSVDNLINILIDKKINGSTTKSGFIIGDIPAVCFQDAPLYGIIQNVENEIEDRKYKDIKKIRYCGNGLLFSKFYIYGKGGRPVIYDNTSEAKKYLPADQYWRIVNLQLTVEPPVTIDWTHEREWRVPGNFDFEYNLTHVLLHDKASYDHFKDECPQDILEKLHGITILKSIIM